MPDVTPPTVTDSDPPAGSRLDTRRSPVAFTVSDETALALVVVSVTYPSGAEEVAHDGTAFVAPFLASERVSLSASSFRYTLRRAPEWPADPTVRIYAVDSSGNVAGAVVPSNLTAPTISGSTTEGATLTVTSVGTWTGSPTSYLYQWTRGGVDILGATATAYTTVLADVGALIRCEVTAVNAAGSSTPEPSNAIGPIISAAVAPTNDIPPVLGGAVSIGASPTVTPGTWSGTAPITYTYTLRRDGTPITGLVDVSEATIEAHVYVAADIGPTLTLAESATNAAGAAAAISNALAWDDVQAAIDDGARAVWDAEYVSLSGADVATVTDRSGHGNGLSVGTGTAPVYVASDAGFNGEPCITADGGTEWLRTTAFNFGASVDSFGFYAVLRVDSPTTNDLWIAYGTGLLFRQAAGPTPQMAVAGTGGATATASTVMTGAHLVGGDATLVSGNVRALMDGVAESTVANTRAALADGSALALFARTDGSNTAAASLAYAVVLNGPASAGYLANLRAYCQNRFGVP